MEYFVPNFREGYDPFKLAYNLIDSLDKVGLSDKAEEIEKSIGKAFNELFNETLYEYLEGHSNYDSEYDRNEVVMAEFGDLYPIEEDYVQAIADTGLAPDLETAKYRIATSIVYAFQAILSRNKNDDEVIESIKEPWI
jgi:hypothetical protein